MASIIGERWQDLSAEMRHGVPQRLVRTFRMKDIADNTFGAAFEALDDLGIEDGVKCSENGNLIVADRAVVLIDKDKADVTITYEHIMQTDGQRLANPVHGKLFYRTQSGLRQVPTMKDSGGTAISVAHTYPTSDKDWPGQTRTQGGTVDVQVPTKTITLTGLLETDSPEAIEEGILNKTNSALWQGKAAGTWMCVKADHEPFDVESTPNVHRFEFEWQHNADGWNPQVIFKDERTGQPPPNLVADTGYKTVTEYAQIDFDAIFQNSGVNPDADF